jgi:adenylate cyclase
MAQSSALFKDKIILIGYSETRPDSQRKDDFHTVYSQKNGLDLSGIEITASALANLLEDQPLRPLPLSLQLGVLFLWGLITGMLWLLLSPAKAFFYTTMVLCGFIGILYWQFTFRGNWLPLMVPLFFQTPLAGFGALLWNFIDAKKEHEQIKKAFGYYLPDKVVNRLSDRVEWRVHSNCSCHYIDGTRNEHVGCCRRN